MEQPQSSDLTTRLDDFVLRGGQGASNPMRRGGAKSFVDDLGWSRGVVLSRAATILRSIETQPCDSKICSLLTSIFFERMQGGGCRL